MRPAGPVSSALSPFDRRTRVDIGCVLVLLADVLAELTADEVRRLGVVIAAGSSGALSPEAIANIGQGFDLQAVLDGVLAIAEPIEGADDVDELLHRILDESDGTDG